MIQSVAHPCKFTENGCQTKLILAEIYEHEENCLFWKIKCPKCENDVLVNNLSGHNSGKCWDVRGSGKTLVKACILDEDWASRKVFYRLDLQTWDGKDIYVGVMKLEEKEKRVIFLAAMAGNAEERSKYRAHFYLENLKSQKMELVTKSEVLPLQAIASNDVLFESGAFGSVMYKLMERYIYIDGDGDTIFTMKVELDKW